MRTTTIIAPIAASRKIMRRTNPWTAFLGTTGLVLVAIAFGLVMLFLFPLFWIARKLGGIRFQRL